MVFRVVARLAFEAVGHGLDVPGAAERVDDVADTAFEADDLLRTERDLNGLLGGKGEGFVHRVGVERLGPPRTAARAWRVVRTMLFSGCWAVRVAPPVCVWKRIIIERGLFASKRSFMIVAQAAGRRGTCTPPPAGCCGRRRRS